MEQFWDGFEKRAVSAGWIAKKTLGGIGQRMAGAAKGALSTVGSTVNAAGGAAKAVGKKVGLGAAKPTLAAAAPAAANKGGFMRNAQAFMKKNPKTTLGLGIGAGVVGSHLAGGNQQSNQGY